MKSDIINLFKNELNELERAKAICDDDKYKDNELIEEYRKLANMFGKSLKTMMTLTKIGDSQQANLQDIKIQLEKEIYQKETVERKLEYYAFTDTLTEISNRRTGLMLMQREVEKSRRSKSPLSVCSLDIDGLKSVNDKYGHDEGDYLIKTIAFIIKDSIRSVDEVSRMGGDEFLIIFPGCSSESAESVITRIKNIMKDHDSKSGKPFKLEFSYGIVQFEDNGRMGIDELLKEADKRMYMNKAEHKKCVCQQY